MPQIRAAHLGLLWERFYDEFPSLQELPTIDTPEEDFGPGQSRTITVQLMGPAPVPRHWFLSRDNTRVIQVQADRFILNWRQMRTGESYPHYESLRREFEQHYVTFAEFLASRGLGTATIRQAEVTYVNRIVVNQPDYSKGLSGVLRNWQPKYGPEAPFLSDADDIRLVERHIVRDSEGPYARLYISAEPAGAQALVNLTMRGRPRGGTDLRAALGFFDIGRDRIVRGFTAVTTERMHALWRRTK
jgi:uncharacterized protein (TIGR04255 family)